MRSHGIGHTCFSCDTVSPLAPSPDLFLLILPNLVLSRLLKECLNDRAKYSTSVTKGRWSFPIKELGKNTSLSLINLVTVFLLATIFSSISFMCADIKIFCHCFEKVVHMAFESFALLLHCWRCYVSIKH